MGLHAEVFSELDVIVQLDHCALFVQLHLDVADWQAAVQHVVDEDAQRVGVRQVVVALASQRFGGDIPCGADEGVGELADLLMEPAQTEIHDLDVTLPV